MARMTNNKKLALQLAYSRPFNPWVVSDMPAVGLIVEQLLAQYRQSSTIRPQDSEQYATLLKALVLDLFTAYSSDPNVYLRYSRSRSDYKACRYSPPFLGYDILIKLLNFLELTGHIEHHKGFLDRGTSRGRQARMRATGRLTTLFTGHGISIADAHVSPGEEVIVLKVGRKDNAVRFDFEDTGETRRMRANLQTINSYLRQRTILLKLSDKEFPSFRLAMMGKVSENPGERLPIDFSKVTLHRVFNENFDRGGRFYGGWWQSVPGRYRHLITINDKPTVELDYSGLHINILYAMEGQDAPEGDVYSLDGAKSPLRKLLKQIMLIMLNSNGEAQTIGAIQKAIKEGKLSGKAFEQYNAPQALIPLINGLKERHTAISRYFMSDSWGMLQKVDSDIAELVMLKFVELDAVALPIHDSFIVFDGYQEPLQRIMEDSFKAILGKPGIVKLERVSAREKFKVISEQELAMNYKVYSKLLRQYETKVYYLGA